MISITFASHRNQMMWFFSHVKVGKHIMDQWPMIKWWFNELKYWQQFCSLFMSIQKVAHDGTSNHKSICSWWLNVFKCWGTTFLFWSWANVQWVCCHFPLCLFGLSFIVNFGVLILVMKSYWACSFVYCDFCFYDLVILLWTLLNSTTNISDFNVEDLALTIL